MTAMRGSRLAFLHGDRRTSEFLDWQPWLEKAARLVGKFDRELYDDPFSYNETASVSLLASAATQAGYLALAEFIVWKGHKADRRMNAAGRCDLWIYAERKTYALEFKQSVPLAVTEARWTASMNAARQAAKYLRADEADERVAALVVSLWQLDDDDLDDARETLTALAERCDFAWHIQRKDGEASDTFLYFDVM
ncbi:hypothetical protein [uncultured Alsobacter sp.]|uniref:hypothetical protein n=1 Tax=uncultured Alsobacter sp. TaxID=1748258 RepID=UPI0025E64336|nr:hypothetical protein [uncultured Alsobacter sp.]